MASRFFNIAVTLTLILQLINLLSYFDNFIYSFEILTHFRLQYFFLFLLSCLFFIAFYRHKTAKKWLLLSALGLLINVISIAPIYVKPTYYSQTTNSTSLLLANVLSSNKSKEKFIDLIQQQQADFVVALEVDFLWAKALESIYSDYPYRLIYPRNDNFGIALFSKYPLLNIQKHDFSKNQIPSISATVHIAEKNILMIATHPFPPMNKEFLQQQKNHFKAITEFLKKNQLPVIVAGDFNTTFWSSTYRTFIDNSSLKNTREGYGIIPSWQAGSVLQIPLDHILVSQNINTTKIEAMKSINSDHLPIYVELDF